MEKVFIGKVKEKVFQNGGSIITLSLSPDDKTKLAKDGWDNIDIKKSIKGTWYAEISQFKPQEAGKAYQQQPVQQSDISDSDSGLPF